MKRKIVFSSLLAIGLIIVSTGFIAKPVSGGPLDREFELLKIVKYHVKNGYVDKNLDDKKLEYGAIEGLLRALDDPYTRFMEPKNTKEMETRMQGAFFGIGIHIGMKKDQLTVISPIMGTPAQKAGLKAMDKIVSIDGLSTKGMGLSEAVSKIRGEKGSKVAIGILRTGRDDAFTVEIIRDKIEINAIDKKEVFKNQVGYIRLTTFENHNAALEMNKALRELSKQKIEALVLDLRFNGGGLLSNAITIASMFIEDGAIVHTVDRDKNKLTERANRNVIFSKPLVVLVNEGSASASEILAGAIKDNGRGQLVGMHTFGKASVQRILNLPDGSSVLYTTAKYLTPSGTDITKTGISVNVEIQIPTDDIKEMEKPDYEYSYDKDVQLQKAIEIALTEIKKDKHARR